MCLGNRLVEALTGFNFPLEADPRIIQRSGQSSLLSHDPSGCHRLFLCSATQVGQPVVTWWISLYTIMLRGLLHWACNHAVCIAHPRTETWVLQAHVFPWGWSLLIMHEHIMFNLEETPDYTTQSKITWAHVNVCMCSLLISSPRKRTRWRNHLSVTQHFLSTRSKPGALYSKS